MIAVELAHDFDYAIDRLEIPAPHRAVGNEQRLAETANLDGQKLGWRLWARRARISRTVARIFRSVTRSDCAISATDTPALRRLTIRRSRAALSARALRRPARDRSRRGGDSGDSLVGSVITGLSFERRKPDCSTISVIQEEKSH
jgi:hypothetical protein